VNSRHFWAFYSHHKVCPCSLSLSIWSKSLLWLRSCWVSSSCSLYTKKITENNNIGWIKINYLLLHKTHVYKMGNIQLSKVYLHLNETRSLNSRQLSVSKRCYLNIRVEVEQSNLTHSLIGSKWHLVLTFVCWRSARNTTPSQHSHRTIINSVTGVSNKLKVVCYT